MNIYEISRVYKKPVTAWSAVLKRVENGKGVMPAQYAPLRNAIVKEILHPGTGAGYLDQRLQAMSDTPGQNKIMAVSEQCFANFRTDVSPQIAGLHENYLTPEYRPRLVAFDEHFLSGRLHISVRAATGELAYLFLHPSEWDADETEAHIELLTILAQTRYECARGAVWFVDLRTGTIRRPGETYKRTRAELKRTIAMLNRFAAFQN